MNKKRGTSRRREQFMLYAPLVIWIGVIFFLSSSQGSMNETSRIIRPLLEFFFPAASPETLTFYHGIIRKLAHVTEYAILGFLSMRAFKAGQAILAASVILIGVASIDEINQSFNPARTGSAIDVLLDLAGGFTAVFIVALVRRVRRRTTDA
ncbi:MAG TPA: VanZ family protein [Pyrinomonadaceae bacterium]|nr:VanZ family protein [Pyrinomonadaceae bacterium]